MTESSNLEVKGSTLLNELEHILANDTQLDEVGFIHPSQFGVLNEANVAAEGCESVEASLNLKYDESVFWHRDHKLGISTQAVIVLYKAAKAAFFDVVECYKKGDGKAGENDVMRHSAVLVLLSSDFGTAWNARKMIVSKTQELTLFMNELYLSGLVLSYAPKSDQAWSHRRWVIKTIAGKYSNLGDILEKESRLVERIAERYKMSYRAWYHRGWLISYMTAQQMSHELQDYREWSGLHAADNSCFHYRRRLLIGLLQHRRCKNVTNATIHCSSEIQKLWKEELDWNESLIKRYIGREALWLHRRFLSVYCIKQMGVNHENGTFMNNELNLIQSCMKESDDCFEDAKSQVTHAATYALWLRKQIEEPHVSLLRKLDLRTKLNAASPEKILLWDPLFGQENLQA